ncbi:MAG TPA: (2Fe-2S)-binding protein, partial [Anaerolineae bacterium]|nr:(2Fe-2S)-binding protein [Anaerolineae bacterium]
MTKLVTFRINGKERTVAVEPDLYLLDVIRDVLHLTGTKRGCDNATCGACMVIVNGKAVKSCTFPLDKAQGAEVLTIEGLAQGAELHPIQQSLIESGAVQCGFCTPGIVMELYALLENKPEATEAELRNALNKHLCRCTAYEAIWEGALLAQQRMREG